MGTHTFETVVKYNFNKEECKEKKISLQYIKSEEQTVDVTKAQFLKFRTKLGVYWQHVTTQHVKSRKSVRTVVSLQFELLKDNWNINGLDWWYIL